MRPGIHPEYKKTLITCACGRVSETRSTVDELHVEICSHCHPFFTGRQKLVDTAGRVERFIAKYGEGGSRVKAEEADGDIAVGEPELETEPVEAAQEAEAQAEPTAGAEQKAAPEAEEEVAPKAEAEGEVEAAEVEAEPSEEESAPEPEAEVEPKSAPADEEPEAAKA